MKRMYMWWGVGVAVIIVLAIVGFFRRPEYVVNQAITQLDQADTARYTALLQLENADATQQVLGEKGAVELQLDGVFAKKEQPPALQARFQLLTKTESVSVNIEGETRFIGDKAFVYIEKSPALFEVLTVLKGQWIEFPRGGASAEVGIAPKELFTSVKRDGTEQLGNERVTRYTAVARDEAVIAMMDGIAKILGTNLTNDQISSLRASVDKVQEVPVELKVSRWGNNLRQLSTVLDIPGANTVRFTLTLNEVNQPVAVTAPEGARNLQDALKAAAAAQSRE